MSPKFYSPKYFGYPVDFGVHMFNRATPAQEVRLNRGARRNLRRRKWRKQQLKQAFIDFGLLSEEDFKIPEFLSFTANNDYVQRPKDETVYHLQTRALHEKISMRELAMALYTICGTRGHFLMENIDFSKNSIDFAEFKERFYSLITEVVSNQFDTDKLNNDVLKPVFNKQISKANQVRSLFKQGYANNETDDAALQQIILLLIGRKANLSLISENVVLPDTSGKVDIIDLLKRDELNDFLERIVELHDLIEVSNILKEADYICEYNVKKLEHVKEVYKLEKTDPDAYKEEKKKIQSYMSKTGTNRLRVIKNMQNKFPNGMYVHEATSILKKQKEFYPEITDEFIEVCSEIIKARIPYYVGPLSKNAKNSWLVQSNSEKFKYSYHYSVNKYKNINEFETIKQWKKAMISHCTYLPEETALPKGSFLGETFSICNELNILQALDSDGNQYYLTLEDKIKVFDQLFLQKETVSYKDICQFLGLSKFGPRNTKGQVKFNNRYTLYHRISKILPELRLNGITDIYLEKEKIEKLEDLILNINLFDEEISKKQYFIQVMNMDEKSATALSKLKVKGFYTFSEKFIAETPMNTENQSLLEELMNDNSSEYMNEQMTLIHQATDLEGNPINFESNKYKKKLQQNHGVLNVDLLIENGKPFIPVSRLVIRSLNECFKVYEEIVEVYGAPKRIVIEAAKDLNESSDKKKMTKPYFEEMKDFYNDLREQIKLSKKHGKVITTSLEDWEELEKYILTNRDKMWLYLRQNGRDMISGDAIDLNNLNDYEIDHILPRGFGDNSMDNLMLIHRNYNSKKTNRLPLEYIEHDQVQKNNGKVITSADFRYRCNELFDLKMINEKKLNRLLLQDSEEAMGFINRDLVDTRYIIRELMAILNAYNQYHNLDSHIVALKASFTNVYRNAFNIRKNRDIGDQHHAYDALTVCLADQVLSTYYPNYDSRGNFKAYQDFIKRMKEALDEKGKPSDFYRFIQVAYKVTFGNYPNEYESIVSYAKRTTPLYSLKVEKNYKGRFFKETLHTPLTNKKDVLTILEVNNDKRAFSDIECVAVDFYKYTTKKGKKKHVAIHIPKVIVDQNGKINKEKYVKLIQEHYKETDLIDENGNIKEYYFRLRVYKNDLIYDTVQQEIQKYIMGSIVKKNLELKHIYCFPLAEIDKRVHFYKKELALHFDFKLPKINPNGKVKISDIESSTIIEYAVENLMDVKMPEKYDSSLKEILKGEKTYSRRLEKMAFLELIVNRNCTWPSIIGQYLPRISTPGLEAQYIKIKSSPLGIRWTHNDKGKLMIAGPKGHRNMYSKIKKEKFSWELE
ncbi:type II CRISPR RNA-guided endonuclease Cas9 [Faecalicoccus acidiformans]|uniref:type II CRISPR RNA-guided endonuclease Cas9 n=1 Tax=Faecalicoccus acidiformans TaxID=915173 RepID=UPI00308111D5